VATVDGGLVLGLALGTTTITAETGGFSASFELPVMPPVVTAIEIGPYGTPGTFGAARPADHVATLRLVDDRFRNWPVLDGGTVTRPTRRCWRVTPATARGLSTGAMATVSDRDQRVAVAVP